METSQLYECWNRVEQESSTLISYKNQLHDAVLESREGTVFFLIDSLLDSISDLRRHLIELEQCYTEHI